MALKDSYVIVVQSEVMGKDEDIGRVLMVAFFDTMLATSLIPDAIFFMNAGVKLTTLSPEIVPILKEIEARGVELFSCGTCLKHYGLEDKLLVGFRGTTAMLLEFTRDADKVIWI